MELRGRSMSPDWKIDSSISTVGFIAEDIARCPREECTYRKKMDGNVHWESRQWKTRSSASRGYHPQSDLRGRLSGILVWVPPGAQPARCAGCAVVCASEEEGELHSGRGHQRLFR